MTYNRIAPTPSHWNIFFCLEKLLMHMLPQRSSPETGAEARAEAPPNPKIYPCDRLLPQHLCGTCTKPLAATLRPPATQAALNTDVKKNKVLMQTSQQQRPNIQWTTLCSSTLQNPNHPTTNTLDSSTHQAPSTRRGWSSAWSGPGAGPPQKTCLPNPLQVTTKVCPSPHWRREDKHRRVSISATPMITVL